MKEKHTFLETINMRLDCLAALEPNWDHEGASPIDLEIIQAARNFAANLPEHILDAPIVTPHLHLYPETKNNLQFEWHDGPKTLEMEFEYIKTIVTIHYLKWDDSKELAEEGFFDIKDTVQVTKLMQWFAETC